MKKFLVIGVIAIVIGFIIYPFFESPEKITNYPSTGRDIVAFGDSLVLGIGSTQGGGFVEMLSEDLGKPTINLGVSGNTTKDALNRIDQISKYKPKVVLVLLGGNDFLQKVPVEEVFANLDKIVEEIQKTCAVVLLIGIEGHVISNSHGKYFKKLAEKRGTAYVPDILDGIFGQTKLMSDNLHPNDLGYRMMTNRIEPVLESVI